MRTTPRKYSSPEKILPTIIEIKIWWPHGSSFWHCYVRLFDDGDDTMSDKGIHYCLAKCENGKRKGEERE